MKSNQDTGAVTALTLTDFKGNQFKLADYLGQKHVVLVFNRGFM